MVDPSALTLVGVDVGGTFTDFVMVARDAVETLKLPTTPDDPAKAILAGVRELRRVAGDVSNSAVVVHGTTLPANAVIERKGARTALVTNRGFVDVADFRRESRYEIFDLALPFVAPLVPPELRVGVSCRVAADGSIEQDLDAELVHEELSGLDHASVESAAVVLLHAHANSAHEEMLRRLLPISYCSLSSEVAPVVGEYERLSTTVINAYVQPLVDRYLERLGRELEEIWSRVELRLMVSNGGVASAEVARRLPVRLIESGPAAGTFAAAAQARRADLSNVLAFDMGGTTAKLGIVRGGEPAMTSSLEVARVARFKRGSGMPLLIRSVDLLEIGAGGGSIAAVDEMGLLAVGPRSSGAVPGPACYGRGGDDATVTDADLLLGYLDPNYFLGGAMALSVEAADAVVSRLASRMGLPVDDAAWGIHDLVDEHMATAARLHLAEHALDPRSFILLATGGAAPVHACHVAEKLGIDRVLCPPKAGVASALGLLEAQPRTDKARSVLLPVSASSLPVIGDVLEALATEARDELRGALPSGAETEARYELEIRYEGQRSELPVPVQSLPNTEEQLATIRSEFERRYRDRYSQVPTPAPALEIVGVRVTALGPPRGIRWPSGLASGSPQEHVRRRIYVARGEAVDARVVPRTEMLPDARVDGPLVVEEAESTTLVPPNWVAWADGQGALHLQRSEADPR